MKKKLISALLTVVMVVTMLTAMCPGVLAAPIELTVGQTYASTAVHTVTSETDIGMVTAAGVVTTTSEEKNGITVTAVISEDKRSLAISYSGTPLGDGVTEFNIKYSTGGVESTYSVAFNVIQPKTEVFPPEITLAEPNNLNQTFKQSDPEVAFNVNATGNGTISYEWKLDGVMVASGETYTLVPADLTVDTHTLECKVENTIEDTTKHSTVTWTVVIDKTAAPVITNEPSTAEIDGTGSASFEVVAEGEELKYQWYMISGSSKEAVKDGKYGNITYSGAETSKLTVSCDMAPQKASVKFMCNIYNPDGLFADSGEYVLTIKEDPDASKVQKIEIASKPDKTEYVVGETLDQDGLKIKVTTGKGTEEITSGFVCSPLYLEAEGKQTITVSYGGKTTEFSVTVNKAPHEHEWSEWKVENSVPVRVSRECIGGDGCTAKEVLSKESFLIQYPTTAAELGLSFDDEEPETDTDTDAEGNVTAPENDDVADADEPTDEEKDDKNDNDDKKKNSGTTVLWIIIIVAAILLAGVIFYYFKVYKKPYKKPNTNNTNIKK